MLKIVLIALALFSVASFAQDPNLHIYLAYGQSNMQGVAPYIEADLETNPRFLVLRAADFSDQKVGELYPAKPPMGNSESLIGVSDFFGRKMIKELPDSIKVAVANVAIGGQSINLFDKDSNMAYVEKKKSTGITWWWIPFLNEYGGDLHKRIVEVGQIAKQKGVIKGFLFHQGEADAYMPNWPSRVKKVYDDFIRELDLDPKKTPILIGEFAYGDYGWRNYAVKDAVDLIPNAHLISAKNCPVLTEHDPVEHVTYHLHFAREGYEILGTRYAEKMLELLKQQTLMDSLETEYHKGVKKTRIYFDAKKHAMFIRKKKHGKDYSYRVTGRKNNSHKN